MEHNFRIMSWNTAKRRVRLNEQIELIQKHQADIVALQELNHNTSKIFGEKLRSHYPHIVSSFEEETLNHNNPKRIFGQLIASKLPIKAYCPQEFLVPWNERIVAVKVTLGMAEFDLITTHIPPGCNNGTIKIEMIKGIVDRLILNNHRHQILCGDFNTPQLEHDKLGLVTWGQKLITRKDGSMGVRLSNLRSENWDMIERSLFEDLAKFGIRDSFRTLNPEDFKAYSWEMKRKGKIFRRRFDHFFASEQFTVKSCYYSYDNDNLSDHSPMIVDYSINEAKKKTRLK
jgi:exonuclease III